MFNLIKYVIFKMQNKIGYEHNKNLTLRTNLPRYCSYYTRYTYGFLNDNTKISAAPITTMACFSSYFSHIHACEEVNEWVLIELNLKASSGNSHFVVMSPEQCLRFAGYFSEMLGYTVELVEPDSKRDNCIYLKFDFKKSNYSKIKFVLTWVRYLWEGAHPFCAYDALRLFDSGIFPDLDLYNLVDLVTGSLTVAGNGYNSGHYITRGAGFVSLDKLEKYISSTNNLQVNNIQKLSNTYNSGRDGHGEGYTCEHHATISTMEQVLVTDRFLERVEIYKKNYEKWKGN